MSAWCFKTAARNTRLSQTHQWYWQIDTDYALLLTSLQLFPTLEACVADAKAKGFRGDVDMPEPLSYPAMISCDQPDDLQALVERSISERFVRAIPAALS